MFFVKNGIFLKQIVGKFVGMKKMSYLCSRFSEAAGEKNM